jgi:RNA polymerase sigma factor (TIGR02999 family)
MKDERGDHTLQPTALVHEACLRLFDWNSADVTSKTHFLGVAAKAMRRALVDHARRRRVRPDRSRRADMPSDNDQLTANESDAELAWIPELESVLQELEAHDPRKARVVELHFFGGLTFDQVAATLGVSTPTVDRDWRFARAWLKTQLAGQSG